MEKIDVNKPVMTRDGRKARIICSDRVFESQVTSTAYPIVALVEVREGFEAVQAYDEYGRYLGRHRDVDDPRKTDLLNVPMMKTGWVNIYESDDDLSWRVPGMVHSTYERARNGRVKAGYITTVSIRWEE